MTTQMVLLAIGIGIGIGLWVVLMIAITRRQTAVSSLGNMTDLLEAIVVVHIPFERDTIGSVWWNRADQRLILTSKTRDEQPFLRGEKAIVVEVEQAQVWVSHFLN